MSEVAVSDGVGPGPDVRIYTPGARARALELGCAGLVAALGAASAWWATFRPERFWGHGARGMVLAVSGALVLAAALVAARVFRRATVLSSDAIAARGLFGDRALRRADVQGYRLIQPEYGRPSVRLYPRQDGAPPLSVCLYRPDARFTAWFEGLADLDAAEAQAAAAELAADPALGPDAATRKAALARWARVAMTATAAGFGLFLWLVARPVPYAAAMAAGVLAPLAALALVVASRGAVSLGELSPTQLRPSVSALVIVPVFGVVLRAVIDGSSADGRPALAAAAAVALAAVAWAGERRVRA